MAQPYHWVEPLPGMINTTTKEKKERYIMPCWEANVLSLDFSAANTDLLLEAAKQVKLNVQQTTWNGERIIIFSPDGPATLTNDPIVIWPDRGVNGQVKIKAGYEQHLQNLRQGYSLAAVKQAAKKSGWEIKPKRNKAGEIEITVGR